MRKHPDFVVGHAVKHLHFFFPRFGADNDKGGALQNLRVKSFAMFTHAAGAYFRKRRLQAMLQIPDNRRKWNVERDRLKSRVQKKLNSFRFERVVDPLVLPRKFSFSENKVI